MQPAHQSQSGRASNIIGILITVALTGITFGSLSQHHFEIDDLDYLSRASNILDHPTALFSPQGFGRPVVDGVFAITFALWGENPAAHHLLLVACHLCAALMLVHVFQKMGSNLALRWVAAWFFLMNVAHFRAVHWISSIAYPLGLIWILATLLLFLRWLAHNHLPSLLAASLSLLLGILTHPSAVAIVPFCFFLGYAKSRSLVCTCKSSWPMILSGLLGLGIVYFFWAHTPQVAQHAVRQFNFRDFLTASVGLIGRLWTSAVWLPAQLHHITPTDITAGIAFLFAGSMLVFMRSTITPWLVWTIVFLLPFIPRIAHPFLTAGPSRYLYLSSVGTAWIQAWMIHTVFQKLESRFQPSIHHFLHASTVLGILALCFISLKRAEGITFYDSGRYQVQQRDQKALGKRLFEKAVERDDRLFPLVASIGFSYGFSIEPRHRKTPEHLLYAGISAFLSSDPREQQRGEEQIQKAFDGAQTQRLLHQKAAHAFTSLAGYYHQNAEYPKAIALYERALSHSPGYATAHFNLGKALYQSGNIDRAILELQRAASLNTTDAQIWRQLGQNLREANRLPEAIEAFQKAIERSPAPAELWYLIGQTYLQNDRDQPAFQALQKAVFLAPQNSQFLFAYFDLGSHYQLQNRLAAAETIYRDIIQIDPSFSMAHVNLGILYYAQQAYAQSVAAFERAVAQLPDDIEALLGLAQAYEKNDAPEKARKTFQRILQKHPEHKEAQNGLNRLNAR